MSALVDKFASLFAGNTEVYGVHIPAEVSSKVGEKSKGQSFTVRKTVGKDQYKQHLLGLSSLGIVPIAQDNTVNFCAIDVDVYPANPQHYIRMIHKYNLPLSPFKSKSGGLHLYIFFSAPCPAAKAVAYASTLRIVLGLPEDTELFPKQKALGEGASGNWINLPYFGQSRTMWGEQGTPLTQEDGIEAAWANRRTGKQIEETLAQLPFAPAPPCLQTMYISGAAGAAGKNRNVFLFNAAVYLKSRYSEDFARALEQVNAGLDRPLDPQELASTIVKSHSKNSYTYQCNDSNLKCFCCKEECKKREFGKGGKSVSEFVYEQLIQVKTDPPYYIWKVNGVDLDFYSEADLRNQDKFADYAMRLLHKVPNTLKQAVWSDVLRTAFASLTIKEAEGEDMTEKTLFYAYFTEFILDRASSDRDNLYRGCVYHKEDTDHYVFKGSDFTEFLYNVKRFKAYQPREAMNVLKKEMGIRTQTIRAKALNSDKVKVLRVWFVDGDEVRNKFTQSTEEMTKAVKDMPDPPPTPSKPSGVEVVPYNTPDGGAALVVPKQDFKAAMQKYKGKSEHEEEGETLF